MAEQIGTNSLVKDGKKVSIRIAAKKAREAKNSSGASKAKGPLTPEESSTSTNTSDEASE